MKNLPTRKPEIREWLSSSMEKIDRKIVFDIHGELFTFIAGFCRAGYTHEILRSKTTKEYAWWIRDYVFEASGPNDPYTSFPIERYPSLETVLEAMIDSYARKWNLME
jgi:hypothetical protein